MESEEISAGKAEIISLLSHPITVNMHGGRKMQIPPSGNFLKIEFIEDTIDHTREGVPIVQKTKVIPAARLPPQREGVFYLVSQSIIENLGDIGRMDFICIDSSRGSGAEYFDEGRHKGKIKSVSQFRTPDLVESPVRP